MTQGVGERRVGGPDAVVATTEKDGGTVGVRQSRGLGKLTPTRRPTAACAAWLWVSTACCIDAAHSSAADASRETTIRPSPRFFTSVAPTVVMAWRNSKKWVRRTSSAPAGDIPAARAVEPTMSVNTTVTCSVSAIDPPRWGGSP
jgi:hypothetical protein